MISYKSFAQTLVIHQLDFVDSKTFFVSVPNNVLSLGSSAKAKRATRSAKSAFASSAQPSVGVMRPSATTGTWSQSRQRHPGRRLHRLRLCRVDSDPIDVLDAKAVRAVGRTGSCKAVLVKSSV